MAAPCANSGTPSGRGWDAPKLQDADRGYSSVTGGTGNTSAFHTPGESLANLRRLRSLSNRLVFFAV